MLESLLIIYRNSKVFGFGKLNHKIKPWKFMFHHHFHKSSCLEQKATHRDYLNYIGFHQLNRTSEPLGI